MRLKLNLAVLALVSILGFFLSVYPFENYVVFTLFILMISFAFKNRPKSLDGVLLAMGVGFLCFCAGANYSKIAIINPVPIDPYSKLTDSFINGQLSLKELPDPRMLALPDPYDPRARANIPVCWDCSLYNGKYYLYWGIAPVLTLYIPTFLITRGYPSEFTAAFWFAAIALIFAYLVSLQLMKSQNGEEATPLERFLILIALLLSTLFAAAIRRPAIYETAIFAGLAYFFGSFFLLNFKERRWRILAGFFFSLAIASRPTILFGGFAITTLIFIQTKNLKLFLREVFLFSLGALPVIVLVFIYNQLRFQSPLDFGLKYQLNHLRMTDWGFDAKDSLFASLAYLTAMPLYREYFPNFNFTVFYTHLLPGKHRYMNDAMVGMFVIAPITAFILFIPWMKKTLGQWRWLHLSFVFAGLLLLFVDSIAGINIRYSIEIIPFFMIPSLVASLSLAKGALGYLKRAFAYGTVFYGANLGFFAALANNNYGTLRHYHPELDAFFTWLYQLTY